MFFFFFFNKTYRRVYNAFIIIIFFSYLTKTFFFNKDTKKVRHPCCFLSHGIIFLFFFSLTDTWYRYPRRSRSSRGYCLSTSEKKINKNNNSIKSVKYLLKKINKIRTRILRWDCALGGDESEIVPRYFFTFEV